MITKNIGPILLGAVVGVAAWEFGLKNLLGYGGDAGSNNFNGMVGRRRMMKGKMGGGRETATTSCWCQSSDPGGSSYPVNCPGDTCNCCPTTHKGSLWGY